MSDIEHNDLRDHVLLFQTDVGPALNQRNGEIRLGLNLNSLLISPRDVYSITFNIRVACPDSLTLLGKVREIQLMRGGSGMEEIRVLKAHVIGTDFVDYSVTILSEEIIASVDGDGIIWFSVLLSGLDTFLWLDMIRDDYGVYVGVDFVEFLVSWRAFDQGVTGMSFIETEWQNDDIMNNRMDASGISLHRDYWTLKLSDRTADGTNTAGLKMPEFSHEWLYQDYANDYAYTEIGLDTVITFWDIPIGTTDNVTFDVWNPTFQISALDPSFAIVPTHASFSLHAERVAEEEVNWYWQRGSTKYPIDPRTVSLSGQGRYARWFGTITLRYSLSVTGIQLDVFVTETKDYQPAGSSYTMLLPLFSWGMDSLADLDYMALGGETLGNHYMTMTHEGRPVSWEFPNTPYSLYVEVHAVKGIGLDLNPIDRLLLAMIQLQAFFTNNVIALVGLASLAVGGLSIGLLKLKGLALPSIATAGSIGIGVIGALFIGVVFPLATLFVTAFAGGAFSSTAFKKAMKKRCTKKSDIACHFVDM